MFEVGQYAMITGDSRCPVGTLVQITEALVCDLAGGMETVYGTEPPVYVEGFRMFFRPCHLAPLEEEVTQPGGLMDLEL